jgi:cell division protein FtsZ
MCDDVLLQAVKGISELITKQGLINIDYADIQTILADAGTAFMGIGTATGQNRAHEAALAAINSPLLDIAIDGAKGVLFAISGGEDMKMQEVHQAAKIITESIDPHAKVIFGAIEDDTLKKGELKVTVIATGFASAVKKRSESTSSTAPASSVMHRDDHDMVAPVRATQKPASSMFDRADIQKEDDDMITPASLGKNLEQLDVEDEDWSAVPAFLRRKK